MELLSYSFVKIPSVIIKFPHIRLTVLSSSSINQVISSVCTFVRFYFMTFVYRPVLTLR